MLVLYSEMEINKFFSSGIAADYYTGCKLFINPYKEFTLENIKCNLYFKPYPDLKIIEEIIPNINYTYKVLSNLVCITIDAGKINDIIEKKGSILK